MPVTENPHALRLYDSLLKHTDVQTAEAAAQKTPLSKSADIDRKFAWAEAVCNLLDGAFMDETIRKIRMDCACGPNEGKMDKLKKLFEASAGLDDFIAEANSLQQGFTLQNNGDHLLLIYPVCCCPVVKRIGKPLPKTWCYCTLGYAKRMLEHALSRPVAVELLESVKSGGKECRIKIVLS